MSWNEMQQGWERKIRRLERWGASPAIRTVVAADLAAMARRRRRVRVLNYHGVRRDELDAFRAQLRYLNDHHAVVDGLPGLAGYLASDSDRDDRGLAVLLTFDDGLHSHVELVAPELDAFGFRGVFFVPSEAMATPASEQGAWADDNEVFIDGAAPDDSRQLFASSEELRSLGQHHDVGCHTANHRRLRPDIPKAELQREIVEARESLEATLHSPVVSFCWVGGEEGTYSSPAERMIEQVYEYSFISRPGLVTRRSDRLQLPRTNVEAVLSVDAFRLQLSRLPDVRGFRSLHRVRDILRVPTPAAPAAG